MRLKIKLQIPFPHVEKIEMCFLERPTIDYVCKPEDQDVKTCGFSSEKGDSLTEWRIQSRSHKAESHPLGSRIARYRVRQAVAIRGYRVETAVYK